MHVEKFKFGPELFDVHEINHIQDLCFVYSKDMEKSINNSTSTAQKQWQESHLKYHQKIVEKFMNNIKSVE